MNRMGEPRLRIRVVLEQCTCDCCDLFWQPVVERRAFEGYAAIPEADAMMLYLQPFIGTACNLITATRPGSRAAHARRDMSDLVRHTALTLAADAACTNTPDAPRCTEAFVLTSEMCRSCEKIMSLDA